MDNEAIDFDKPLQGQAGIGSYVFSGLVILLAGTMIGSIANSPFESILLSIFICVAIIVGSLLIIQTLFNKLVLYPDRLEIFRWGKKLDTVICYKDIKFYNLEHKVDSESKSKYWKLNIYTKKARFSISESEYCNTLQLYSYLNYHLPLITEPDSLITDTSKNILYIGIAICTIGIIGLGILTYLNNPELKRWYLGILITILTGVIAIVSAKNVEY